MKGVGKVSAGYWRGKPIEDYTREELIEIIVQMGEHIRKEFEFHKIRAAEDIKAGMLVTVDGYRAKTKT